MSCIVRMPYILLVSNVLYEFPILEQICSNNGTGLDILVSPEYVKMLLDLHENELSTKASECIFVDTFKQDRQYWCSWYFTISFNHFGS